MAVELALLAGLAEFIGYIKSSNRSVRAVVDDAVAESGAGAGAAAVRDESFLAYLQVLLSEALQGKEEALDAAAVASSARSFLAALFVCCAEVGRLTRAVEGRCLGAATDDDMDVDTHDDMDVDGGRPAPGARHRQDESGVSACSVAAARFCPSSGGKRKRACAGGGGGGEVDTARPHKRRRVLAWMRSHLWLPFGSGSGRLSSAPRAPRSRYARTVAMARSRIRRPIGKRKPDARTVALATMASSRIRRRIGKPTTARHRSQPSLGQHFSRISL